MRRAILARVPHAVAGVLALLIAADLASAAQGPDTTPRAVPSPYAWTPHSDELPSDPRQVAEVAIGDPDPYRRLAAVAALRTQPELARVVARAPDVTVRRLAIAALTDSAAIGTALVHDADPMVRARAAAKCRDPLALVNHFEFHPGPAAKADDVRAWGASPSSLSAFAYVAVPADPRCATRAFCIDSNGAICATRGGRPRVERDGCVVTVGERPASHWWTRSPPEDACFLL